MTPKNLDQIIGQDRPLKIVRGLLTDVRKWPRLVVVDGPHGVGKTSLINILTGMLEDKNIQVATEYDPNSYCLLETNDYNSLPADIRSRACRLHFGKINSKDIIGYLTNYCTTNNIQYSVEGLSRITRKCQGDLRKALSLVNIVSSCGPKITKDLVLSTIDNNVDEIAYKILTAISGKDFKTAIELSSDYENKDIVSMIAEYYGKCFFDFDDTISREDIRIRETIKSTYHDFSKVNDILLKWDRVSSIPISLFFYELSKCCTSRVSQVSTTIMTDVESVVRTEPVVDNEMPDVLRKFKDRVRIVGDYK